MICSKMMLSSLVCLVGCFICLSSAFNMKCIRKPSYTQLHCSSGSESPCSSCKWFIPHNREDLGLCGLYKTTYQILGVKMTIHEFAEHCRNNESLCGNEGYMYEPIIRPQRPS